MKVRIVKRSNEYYPQKRNLLGIWVYFSEEIDIDHTVTVRFDTIEKAIEFLQSTNETEQVVYEGEV